MIWREKRILLIVLGLLLLANTIFFFTYRVQYVSRLQDLDARQAQAAARLDQARHARITAEQRLAAASHLEPPSYQFTAGETKNTSIVSNTKGSIGTTTVEIAFTVQGTYEQVRRLINMLELSDQFVIIDGIGLTSSSTAPGDKTLTLNIKLK